MGSFSVTDLGPVAPAGHKKVGCKLYVGLSYVQLSDEYLNLLHHLKLKLGAAKLQCKQDIWQKITAAVNEAEGGLGNQTVEEVKKKNEKFFFRQPGVTIVCSKKGSPPKISPYSTIIIDVFGDNSPAFTGLRGCDTSASNIDETAEKQVEAEEDGRFSSISNQSSDTSYEGNIKIVG